jgi:hypothetical protein
MKHGGKYTVSADMGVRTRVDSSQCVLQGLCRNRRNYDVSKRPQVAAAV